MGGLAPPQGSALWGEAGEAAPQGSAGAAPHGPEAEGRGTVCGGEGPAEPTGAAAAEAPAAAAAPQGSTAPSSMRAPWTGQCGELQHTAMLRDGSTHTTHADCRGRGEES